MARSPVMGRRFMIVSVLSCALLAGCPDPPAHRELPPAANWNVTLPRNTAESKQPIANPSPLSSFTVSTSDFFLFRAGDLNGDLKDDLIWFTDNEAKRIGVLLAQGKGKFLLAGETTLSQSASQLAIGDYDRDRIADIAYRTDSGFGYLHGRGDGSFQDKGVRLRKGPLWFAAGDFDGDGFDELGVADSEGLRLENRTIRFPSPLFETPAFRLNPRWRPDDDWVVIEVADLNADRIDDLVMTSAAQFPMIEPERTLVTYVSSSGKAFAATRALSLPNAPHSISAGDFNGDGKLDLVIQYRGKWFFFARGSGDGLFQTPVAAEAQFPIDDLQFGHLDGDGKLDVVLKLSGPLSQIEPPDYGPKELVVYRGDGKGNFSPAGPRMLGIQSFALLRNGGPRIRYMAVLRDVSLPDQPVPGARLVVRRVDIVGSLLEDNAKP